MRTEAIRAEMVRALKSLQAAELLHRQELVEDAVSRAYYAVMHASKAALLVKDVVAESHSAVRRLFGRDLIKTGELEKEWARILAHEQDQRVGADYDAEFAVGAETAAGAVGDARRFFERIRRYLVSNGVDVDEGL